jgi:transposase-like protein
MLDIFMNKVQREIQRKLPILHYADEIGHVAKACRNFGIGRASFYRWRSAYQKHGESGLVNRETIPKLSGVSI